MVTLQVWQKLQVHTSQPSWQFRIPILLAEAQGQHQCTCLFCEGVWGHQDPKGEDMKCVNFVTSKTQKPPEINQGCAPKASQAL